MTSENGNNTGIEVVEQEIETTPDAGGLVKTETTQSVEDQLFLAENIEKIIAAQNKIRAAVLKLAQPGDWVLFKSEAESGGKAEMGFAGSMRIASTLGTSFSNFEMVKEKGTDEKGDWYRWECECDATFRNRTVRVYGRAGSRDRFFGKAHGEYKPLHEVDEGNLKIAARRAAMKEGVKVLFGLHHMDPQFLQGFGIKLDSAGGYSFKSQEKSVLDTQSVNVSIAEVTQKNGTNKNGKPWTKYMIADSEGGMYSTFSKSIAEEAKRNKGTNVPIQIDFEKNDFGFNVTALNGITDSKG